MDDLLVNMLRQAAPISRVRDVYVADIGPEVPDQKVLDFVEAVDLAAGQMAEVRGG
jgi:hypothetical protein